MRTIQFDFGDGSCSKIFYLEDDEQEKRIKIPLGINKNVHLVIKNEQFDDPLQITKEALKDLHLTSQVD